ncbi:MFS multidrug transporter [Hyaloscypha variabilis F]|uniref:MFS multidrug transporter n=1 Tax=Hyaloscypha variabilis (strain UAMH 11265 / GT02V1 / F) TaxID=1149755 RepID=A0A2J6R5V1_HYAVF|nr:MFS multidrug transporter [Hyaloscypha variabilis F]
MDKLEGQDPVGNRDTSSASEPTIFFTSKDMESLQDLEKGTDFETTSEDVKGSWNGADDPKDPFNWPTHRKTTMTVLLSLGGLVCTMSTSMIAPALNQISIDLDMQPSVMQLTLSIYLLAFVFGSPIIASLSEVYGRKPAYILAHVWYILWNTLCPINKSKGLVIAGRFLSGFGGSVSIALAGPSVADIWKADKRGRSLSLVQLAPLLGAAVGPIVGGLVAEHIGWKWIFWIVSAFDGTLLVLYALFVQESYAPVLLARRASSRRSNTEKEGYTQFDPTLPMKLLATRPVILVMSFLMAYNFGAYCLALSTFASIWTARYNQSETVSGLHYIAIGIGSTIATQAGGPLTDRIWAHLKTKSHGKVAPEYRVPLLVPGALLIVTDIGAAMFSGGVMMSSSSIVAYIIDEFGEHAASANAASRMLSNVMGFSFPLFAPQLYKHLGHGWGNSLLAFLYIAIGWPAPILLWKWGAKLRAVGRKN